MLPEETMRVPETPGPPRTGIIPLDPGFNCTHNSLKSMEKPAEALNSKTTGSLFNQVYYLSIPGCNVFHVFRLDL